MFQTCMSGKASVEIVFNMKKHLHELENDQHEDENADVIVMSATQWSIDEEQEKEALFKMKYRCMQSGNSVKLIDFQEPDSSYLLRILHYSFVKSIHSKMLKNTGKKEKYIVVGNHRYATMKNIRRFHQPECFKQGDWCPWFEEVMANVCKI